MIAFIDGTITEITEEGIVLDYNGMGFEMSYPHLSDIRVGQSMRVHTYLHITENDMRLFGFASVEEKNLFLRLISVKGVGPKTAVGILRKAGYQDVFDAIAQNNVSFLKTMPGIGPKAASQIVLDLQGKLIQVSSKKETKEVSPEIQDAADALQNFGYKQGEIAKAVNIMSEKPGLSTQEYIRIGLKALMKNSIGG